MNGTRQPVDRGIATPVELVFLTIAAVAAVMLIGFLGRLHAAGVEVANAAQSAARAASLADGPAHGEQAAEASVRASTLSERCAAPPLVDVSWRPSSGGSWRGGSVTVTVRCTVDSGSLAALWSPGVRTISMSDTQPIDRFKP